MSLVLQARGLKKSFITGTTPIDVLQGVDLELPPATSISIRGESGCGKTTLLHLLSGLESADDGAILWSGDEVTRLGNTALAKRRARFCGMIFQSYFLVPELNALENILLVARIASLPRPEALERAHHLLARVGLQARARSLPATLSGGERQRVAVARALINRPAVVFADEPTGNLDEHTSEDVLQLLLDVTLSENASLVLVTHNAAHAARTHLQARLHNGHLQVSHQLPAP